MEPMAEALLKVAGLRKSFGALAANDGVDFEVHEGETHAIIGPNGAGKTTFISQLSGMLRPDEGRIHFAGEDITALPGPARSLKGLARSFQITSIYREFTALDNVALAVQAHAGHSFRFWRPARADAALREVEQLLLADLRGRRFVLDFGAWVANVDIREGISGGLVADQHRVAL